LHALDRFDAQRPLRPWLLRITANLVYNRQRGARRHLAALQRLLRSEPPPLSARQQAEQNLETGLLWQAIRRLGTDDQRVIYLRYFLDCPEAEAAEALGVAVGTVKSRLHRALGRLRQVIREEFPHLAEEQTDER
jgi:RNA polymerase sigma-70 factor (ECF subfamily)